MKQHEKLHKRQQKIYSENIQNLLVAFFVLALLVLAFASPFPASATSEEVLQLNEDALSDMSRGDLEQALNKLDRAQTLDPSYKGTVDNLRKWDAQKNAKLPIAEQLVSECISEVRHNVEKKAPTIVQITDIGQSSVSNMEKARTILPLIKELQASLDAEERAVLDAVNALIGMKSLVTPQRYLELQSELRSALAMHMKEKLTTILMFSFAYEVQGDLAAAVQEINKYLLAQPDEGARYEQRSYLFFKSGSYDKALEDVVTAMRLDGTLTAVCMQRACAVHTAMKKYDDAIADIDKAIASADARPHGRMLSQKAAVFALKGDAALAQSCMGQARHYGSVDPFFESQVMCLVENNPAGAVASLTQQLPAPNLGVLKQGDILAWRALCHAKLKDFKSATDDIVAVERLNARNAPALDVIAMARAAIGNEASTPVPTGARAVDRPVGQKWALLVGIGKYGDDTIPVLRYPSKDAKDFADYLVSTAHWQPDHVKVLVDEAAKREDILDALGDSWLPQVVGADDLVVVFLSTHGTPAYKDVGALNYVVAHNTQKRRLFSTGIAMQDICDIIRKRLKADRILLVLDCCYSGASALVAGTANSSNVNPQQVFTGFNQLVICSSDNNQRSWESTKYPNGIFTRKLLDSFKAADCSDFEQLYERVRTQVQQEVASEQNGVQQVPQRAGKWQSKTMFSVFKPKSVALFPSR